MIESGLLGKKLGHSYSPQIHQRLGNYRYELYEKEENEIEDFLKNGTWNGINVTIPYKKTVFPYMASVSETVKLTGSVNTIVRKPNGELYGDNTDVYGFVELLRHSGIAVGGKKVLVLGSGGASASVLTALNSLGAKPVIISRRGPDNYDNLDRHADAEVVVNTTPVGMYPNNGFAPLDLKSLSRCNGVIDLIYNPSRTKLLLQAEELGIPHEDGLYMLIAQAKRSSELFTESVIEDIVTEQIYRELRAKMQNIVLVGMPGCGKSTIAELIAKRTGRAAVDSDTEIERMTGEKPSKIIIERGEKAFRDIEAEVIADIGKRSGAVIATGGGSVLREENYRSLHQNGIIIWIERDVSLLPSNDRPLSAGDLGALLEARKPFYRRYADMSVVNESDFSITADRIIAMINANQ